MTPHRTNYGMPMFLQEWDVFVKPKIQSLLIQIEKKTSTSVLPIRIYTVCYRLADTATGSDWVQFDNSEFLGLYLAHPVDCASVLNAITNHIVAPTARSVDLRARIDASYGDVVPTRKSIEQAKMGIIPNYVNDWYRVAKSYTSKTGKSLTPRQFSDWWSREKKRRAQVAGYWMKAFHQWEEETGEMAELGFPYDSFFHQKSVGKI
jgi:hypothetical protein